MPKKIIDMHEDKLDANRTAKGTRFAPPVHRKVLAERILLHVPANVVTAARISGNLDPDLLRNVIERLRARHALLAVRVSFDADQNAWFESEGVPPIPVRVVERKSDTRWLEEVEKESRQAFPLERGPLMRATLVSGPENSELILCGHHVITDGKSMVFLLRDILHHLAHPEDPVTPLPEPPLIDETTVPDPPKFGLLMKGVTGLMNWVWSRKNRRFGPEDQERMHGSFWRENAGMRALAFELAPEQTDALVARCRREKVTVNSALWAAFLAAQYNVQGAGDGFREQAGMAVSTRDRLHPPAGEAVGFYASSLSTRLAIDPEKPFWDTVRHIHGEIKTELNRTNIFRMLAGNLIHPTLLDALYYRKYGLIDDALPAKFLRKMKWDGVHYGYSITNVGRADIPETYGPFQLEAVYGPFFYSDVNEKVVGITTAAGRLTMIMAFDEKRIGKGTAEKILDRALGHLERGLEN